MSTEILLIYVSSMPNQPGPAELTDYNETEY